MEVEIARAGEDLELTFRPRNPEDRSLIEKRLRFDARGGVRASYRWNPAGLPADSFFSTEMTLSRELPLRLSPQTPVWTFAVQTVAKSERGLDETHQGDSITPRWPIALGHAAIEITPGEAGGVS
jgi:hypothetical protein